MFPTKEQIADFFTAQIQQKGELLAALQNLNSKISQDINFKVVGEGFSIATQTQGMTAFQTYLASTALPAAARIFDAVPPRTSEVIRVTGGGDSPYAVALFKDKFSHKGKFSYTILNNSKIYSDDEPLTCTPFTMNYQFALKYNDQGQVSELVIYGDTLFLQNLLDGKI